MPVYQVFFTIFFNIQIYIFKQDLQLNRKVILSKYFLVCKQCPLRTTIFTLDIVDLSVEMLGPG